MADIVVDRLTKVFSRDDRSEVRADVIALKDVNMHVRSTEIVSVLGPSGCGKTTLLAVIAGFQRPTRGRILVGGNEVTRAGPDRMVVFQTPALFPWLTVMDNIVLGPKRRKVPKRVYTALGQQLVAAVGLEGFEESYPYELSGGMRQRVQIARALISEPQVLLMDEPFGALDAQTRLLMQEQLLQVWDQFHPTILFITHDVEEALFLSDRVQAMTARPGRIKDEIVVPFPKPRTIDILTSPEFVALKEQLLQLVREEVQPLAHTTPRR